MNFSKTWDNVVKFFKSVSSEYKRITWPTNQQLYAYTLVVLFTLLVVTGYLSCVDLVIAYVAKTVGM